MIFTDSLTTEDPDDWYFFSVSSDRSILFELQSNNPNYIVHLYVVDWNTGIAYPTILETYAGNLTAHNQLPAGDWALRVYSDGSLGDTYTIKMNATNPSGAMNIYSASNSLQYVVLGYGNGDIYSNGNYVAIKEGNNNHLNCVNGHDKIDINGHEKPAKPVI